MRIFLFVIVFMSSLLLVWCGSTQPTSPSDTLTGEENTFTWSGVELFSWRTITSNDYSVESVTPIPQTYSGEEFTIVKVTHIPTTRWTYIIAYDGNRAEFYTQRANNIFNDGMIYTWDLQTDAFSFIGTGENTRWRMQVPVDRVLLAREYTNGLLVIDADDPSGERNMMNEQDLEEFIEFIEQE